MQQIHPVLSPYKEVDVNYSICFGVVCFAVCTMVGVQSNGQVRRGPNRQPQEQQSQEQQPQVSLVDETTMQEVSAEDLDAAYAELEETHAQHYKVLQELRTTLPESARPAIDKAMQNSEQGWRRAREARQRIGSRLRKVIDGVKPDSAGKGVRGKDGRLDPAENGAQSEGDGSQGLGNQQGRTDQGSRGTQRILPGLGLPTFGGSLERIGQGNSKGKGPRR